MAFIWPCLLCCYLIGTTAAGAGTDNRISPPPTLRTGAYDAEDPTNCGSGEVRVERGPDFDTILIGGQHHIELVKMIAGVDEQNNCQTIAEFHESHSDGQTILSRTVTDAACPVEVSARTLGWGLLEIEQWTFKSDMIQLVHELYPGREITTCRWHLRK